MAGFSELGTVIYLIASQKWLCARVKIYPAFKILLLFVDSSHQSACIAASEHGFIRSNVYTKKESMYISMSLISLFYIGTEHAQNS